MIRELKVRFGGLAKLEPVFGRSQTGEIACMMADAA